MNNTFFTDNEKNIPRGTVRTRFAPSPTGYMHVGNLRTALYAYLIAKKNGGTFILRIEDTDKARQVEGAEELIYKTLASCGIIPDESPKVGGLTPPYIQSERRGIYKQYAEYLVELGGAYRDAEAPDVIRQRIPQDGATTFSDLVYGTITTPNADLDENVLIKSDGLPTYNFANVIDDHLMGITHIVRGSEYLSSTPKYNLLYEAFGWTPPEYIHCPPVMRDKQNKMSKRHGDPSFEDLAEQGFLPAAIVNYVALLGWSPGGERELFTLSELSDSFTIEGISKSPSIFDIIKLRYFNSEYIKRLTDEEFRAVAAEDLNKIASYSASPENALVIERLTQPRIDLLSGIAELWAFLGELPDYGTELFVHAKSKSTLESAAAAIVWLIDALEQEDSWDNESLTAVMTELSEAHGVKKSVVMWPARIAMAGQAVTPGGATEIAVLLGKAEAIRRLTIAAKKLSAEGV
ncbi:MAG: glutamate--tRNA ligase [Oscillospiraceae bacterium]|nr:glutamate--tRNA ligase [Oscillospiraceae bacterium]